MAEARCYVLDVGQGMSSVVVLPGGRVLIIDGGPSAQVPLQLLARTRRPLSIEAIVVTHNDDDHARGVVGIAVDHLRNLKRIWCLVDREPRDIRWLNELIDSLNEADRELLFTKLARLETDDVRRRLWPEEDPPSPGGVRLRLLFPTFWQNLETLRRLKKPTNDTCGVVDLRCGDGSVIFPGDAPRRVWQELHDRFGRLTCDVLVFPHHGGAPGGDPDQAGADTTWLLQQALECRQLVVFSVGTSNTYDHPLPDVVRSAKACGPSVACTQATDRCCPDPAAFAPGLLPLQRYSERPALCSTGSRGVGCMGTIEITLDDGGARVEGLAEHVAAVDQAATDASWHPLCR